MTIREYNLTRQGHERELEDRRRREAEWMAMILNTQYPEGEITAALLLGEAPEKDTRAKLRKADKALAKRLAKRAKDLPIVAGGAGGQMYRGGE